ncbi:hypothetical protein LTR27_009115 [Elasticomyces elasticus]|nr:hypothetical protein LTR27_009115 [Elasticomyces elasticus]
MTDVLPVFGIPALPNMTGAAALSFAGVEDRKWNRDDQMNMLPLRIAAFQSSYCNVRVESILAFPARESHQQSSGFLRSQQRQICLKPVRSLSILDHGILLKLLDSALRIFNI